MNRLSPVGKSISSWFGLQLNLPLVMVLCMPFLVLQIKSMRIIGLPDRCTREDPPSVAVHASVGPRRLRTDHGPSRPVSSHIRNSLLTLVYITYTIPLSRGSQHLDGQDVESSSNTTSSFACCNCNGTDGPLANNSSGLHAGHGTRVLCVYFDFVLKPSS